MKKEKLIVGLVVGAAVAAATYKLLSKEIPDGAVAVQPFDKERYMGLWYEVARLPNFIEKSLINVTDEYFIDTDGEMKVVTKALHTRQNKKKIATGKMKFAGAPNIGMLKVSFLGPFYLPYNVLDIDKDYRYALVSGSGLDYLWIISRETTIPDHIKAQFLKTATAIGFDISKLEWVSHEN